MDEVLTSKFFGLKVGEEVPVAPQGSDSACRRTMFYVPAASPAGTAFSAERPPFGPDESMFHETSRLVPSTPSN